MDQQLNRKEPRNRHTDWIQDNYETDTTSLGINATPIYTQMTEEQYFRQTDRWWYENAADLMLFGYNRDGSAFDYYKPGEDAIYHG